MSHIVNAAQVVASVEADLTNTRILSIAGTSIPHLLGADVQGPYNQLYAYITQDYQSPVNLTILPVKRATRAFYEGNHDCLFVSTSQEEIYGARGLNPDDLITSDEVNRIYIRAYTRPDEPEVTSVNDMQGMTVALDIATGTAKMFRDRFLPASTHIISTNSPDQAFALLNQRRVDAVITFDFDANMLIQRDPNIAMYRYNSRFIIGENDDVILCKKSAESQAFIAHANDVLARLRTSGDLARLLGKPTSEMAEERPQ